EPGDEGAMEAYTAGLELLAEDDLDGALGKLTEAVEADGGKNADFLVKRATVLGKLKRYAESLADARKAAEIDAENGVAHFRAAVAAFQLERFGDAQQGFERAKALLVSNASLAKQTETWLRKCAAELEDAAPGPSVVEETPAAADPVPAPAAPSTPAAKPDTAFPFDWFQSLTHVTIEIRAKGMPQDKVKSEITATNVSIDIELESAASTFSYDWDLFAEIDPSASRVKVMSKKIEVRLKKADANVQWLSLEAGSKGTTMTAGATGAAGAAPPKPSAYASKKNWDAIEKEIEKEEADDKPEGDAALNKLFQDIYKNASDETRRAMVKSFQTSGGTVLSTNWDEVGKKDYEKERPAPNGMEWRSWEGDKLDVEKEED
ncbi:Protein SGT1 homolog A (AtSGT1a) (Suppressor of G2 allele of SKP1 homolog A), partial [Durusdinium trenchii]